MTNPHANNSQRPAVVSPAAFARFLEILAADSEEAGRLYARLHKKLSGFFALRGLSDPESAADETLERAIIKIEEGATVPDVNHYCAGIARNIAKERLRRMQRETSAFSKFLEDTAQGVDDRVDRVMHVLKPCFEQLAGEDQRLLESYCGVLKGRARAEHRRRLAESMSTTVLALRMRVTRLRSTLTDCVRERLKQI